MFHAIKRILASYPALPSSLIFPCFLTLPVSRHKNWAVSVSVVSCLCMVVSESYFTGLMCCSKD